MLVRDNKLQWYRKWGQGSRKDVLDSCGAGRDGGYLEHHGGFSTTINSVHGFLLYQPHSFLNVGGTCDSDVGRSTHVEAHECDMDIDSDLNNEYTCSSQMEN